MDEEEEILPTTIKQYIKATFEFGKYVTKNLDGKKFLSDTPFAFKANDEIFEIDGKDVRQWDGSDVKKLLKKGQSMFGHVFAIIVARPSGPNFQKVMSADHEQVSESKSKLEFDP